MKLQPLLTEYLMEHGNLPLPDARQLSVTHTAAAIAVDQQTINPPEEVWSFSPEKPSETSVQELVKFISDRLNFSQKQAQYLLSEEGNLLNQFTDQQNLDWAGIGYFKKQNDGGIEFSQEDILSKYLHPISLQPFQKTQQQEAAVEVVTEEEQEPFYGFAEPEKKNYWWVWAIIIFLVSAVLIFFRYYLG